MLFELYVEILRVRRTRRDVRFQSDAGVSNEVLRGGNMFRRMCGFVGFGFLFLYAMSVFAQSSSAAPSAQPCDKSCQQRKVDALFKAMDEEAASDRPRPSQSKECSAFDGRDTADTLTDVCAKLKYVRSIAVGTDTNFSCPRDTSSLVGLPANRIRSIWGEPNFVERATSPNRAGSGTRWSYFIGSPKPGQEGGGFPELSLRLVDGVVGSVSCALSM